MNLHWAPKVCRSAPVHPTKMQYNQTLSYHRQCCAR